ncbi:DUF7426 family protein [Ornithinimicrobium cerasi]|uniref:DUF7426 family protein n=1 Tax=Ornithinimicrobium cerasi TaxID=2248773 RepID=UPI000EFEEC04|nr:hypothetical protein [Ornithinimicrobium cerasi]
MSDTFDLPVAGRTYTIASPPARVGLAQAAAFTIAAAKRKGTPPPPYAVDRYTARYGTGQHEMDQDALGDAWEAMQDDLTLPDLKRAAAAAHIWIVTGSERAALAVLGLDLEEGGSGPKASTTTDEAPTTPPPASTSGTTSPRPASTPR